MAVIIRYLLLLYKKVNVFPSRCRFYPSCSNYADQAVERFGVSNGLFLALKRLIRCNQFYSGGFDPVPEK